MLSLFGGKVINLWHRVVRWYKLGYWGRMTDEKAQAISLAIFIELGAIEAGRFDRQWEKVKTDRERERGEYDIR